MNDSALPRRRGRPPKPPPAPTPSVDHVAFQTLRGKVAHLLETRLGQRPMDSHMLAKLSAELVHELHFFASTTISPLSDIHRRRGPRPQAAVQTLLAKVFTLLRQHGVQLPRSWHNSTREVQELELFCKALLAVAGMKARPISARTVRSAFLTVDQNDATCPKDARP